MKNILAFLIFLVLFIFFTKSANAIVVVIPVVLVPIVKIVALIITSLFAPVVGLSILYINIKKKPIVYGIMVGLIVLIILGMLIAFGIKIVNPDLPLY